MSDQEINPVLSAGITHTLASASDATILETATNMIPATLISGLTQLANAAESVADVVGLGWGQLDTATAVHAADELLNTNMSEYYKQHQEGADLIGFIGSSLVPGTIGVKALRAAQAGIAVGRTTSIATGLLTNTAEVQLLNRAKNVIESGASITQINKARVAAALARGGQLALEGIAFDMAVFSAMNDNPVLADMSAGDQFKHSIMFGALFGGLGAGWNYFSQFNKAFTVAGGSLAGQQTSLKAIEYEVGIATTDAGRIELQASGKKTNALAPEMQVFDPFNPTTPLKLYHGSAAVLTEDIVANYKSKFKGIKGQAIFLSADPGIAAAYATGKTKSAGVLNTATVYPKNPMVIRFGGVSHISEAEFAEAVANNMDSVIRVDDAGIVREIAVLDKTIIKNINETVLTHGDSAVDLSKALRENFAPLVREELDAVVATTRTRREEVLKTEAAKVATALTGDSGLGPLTHSAILEWDTAMVASVFTGAVRISRLGAEDSAGLLKPAKGAWRLSSSGLGTRAAGVDLTTGAMSFNPELSMADFANSAIAKKSVTAGDLILRPGISTLTGASKPIEGEMFFKWGKENNKNVFDISTPEGVIAAFGAHNAGDGITVVNSAGVKTTFAAQDPTIKAVLSNAKDDVMLSRYIEGDVPDWAFNQAWESYVAPTARWAKVEYNTWIIPSSWQTRGLAAWNMRVEAAKSYNRAVVASVFPDMQLPAIDITSVSAYDYRQASGLLKSTNAAYQSAMEAAAFVGGGVQNKAAALRETRALTMLNAEQALRSAGEKSETAVLFNAMASRIRGESNWVLLDKESRLIYMEHASPYSETTKEVLLSADESTAAATVYNYFEALQRVDIEYVASSKKLDAISGAMRAYGPENGIYLPPYDLSRSPYTVIVADPTGATSLVRARTAEELQTKIRQIRTDFPEYSVYSKADTDAYYNLKGEWEFASAFTRTATDSALLNKGIMRDLDVKAGWQELDTINAGLSKKELALIRRSVSAHYAQEFAEASALSRVSNPFHETKLATAGESTTPNTKLGADAYSTLINTALNVRDSSAHPYWEYFNTGLNKLYAGASNTLWDLGARLRSGGIGVTEANKILQQRGVFDAAFTDELWALAAKPDFSTAALDAMARIRHLLNTTVLRLDFFNPVVQILGMPIMLIPAVRAATSEIRDMGQEVPAFKMLGTAIKNLFNPSVVEHFTQAGIVSKGLAAHAAMVDAAGLLFKADSSARVLEQAGIVQSKFDRFVNFFSKPTDYAEHAQRFIAADVARQITSVRGLVSGTPEYWAFINNFVSKVNGTYVAAQRPTLFTGIAGQAISVFQTYQFNLMQQFARHIENGDRKTLAIMLGLQGTIYGAASLPAFKLLNQQLLGEFNRDNTDAYSLSAKYLPETMGNFMMYGAASNLLGAALWSRGDVTPRNPTLVPITPQDTVAVSMGIKAGNAFMDVLHASMGQFKDANPNFAVSIGEAIAHAGINRPLSGLAELALGARTSMDGKLDVNLRQQDVLSWATAVRLLGAKPLDEAIAMDAYNRQIGYRAAMRERTAAIGEALRSHALGTGDIPPDTIDKFAEAYTRVGGDIENFRSTYMRAIRDATTPRAVILAQQMRESPSAKNYQWAMGADGELPSADNFLVGDDPTK